METKRRGLVTLNALAGDAMRSVLTRHRRDVEGRGLGQGGEWRIERGSVLRCLSSFPIFRTVTSLGRFLLVLPSRAGSVLTSQMPWFWLWLHLQSWRSVQLRYTNAVLSCFGLSTRDLSPVSACCIKTMGNQSIASLALSQFWKSVPKQWFQHQ